MTKPVKRKSNTFYAEDTSAYIPKFINPVEKRILDLAEKSVKDASSAETTPAVNPIRKTKQDIKYPASCLECRRRKIKCDRVQPCYSCARKGTECTYPEKFRSISISHILDEKLSSANLENEEDEDHMVPAKPRLLGVLSETTDRRPRDINKSHSNGNTSPTVLSSASQLSVESAMRQIETLKNENKMLKRKIKSDNRHRTALENINKISKNNFQINVEIYKDNFSECRPVFNTYTSHHEYILSNKLALELPVLNEDERKNIRIIEALLDRFFALKPVYIRANRITYKLVDHFKSKLEDGLEENKTFKAQRSASFCPSQSSNSIEMSSYEIMEASTLISLICLFILKTFTVEDCVSSGLTKDVQATYLDLYSRYNHSKTYISSRIFKLEAGLMELEMNVNELTTTKAWAILFESIAEMEDTDRIAKYVNQLDSELQIEFYLLLKFSKTYYCIQCLIYKRPIIDCFPQVSRDYQSDNGITDELKCEQFFDFLELIQKVNEAQLELDEISDVAFSETATRSSSINMDLNSKAKEKYYELRINLLNYLQEAYVLISRVESFIKDIHDDHNREVQETGSDSEQNRLERSRKIMFHLVNVLILHFVTTKITFLLSSDLGLLLVSMSRFLSRSTELYDVINKQQSRYPSPYSILMFRDCFISYNSVMHVHPTKLLPHRNGLKQVLAKLFTIFERLTTRRPSPGPAMCQLAGHIDISNASKVIVDFPDSNYPETLLNLDKREDLLKSANVCQVIQSTYSNSAKVLKKLELLASNKSYSSSKREVTHNCDSSRLIVAISNDEVCVVDNRIDMVGFANKEESLQTKTSLFGSVDIRNGQIQNDRVPLFSENVDLTPVASLNLCQIAADLALDDLSIFNMPGNLIDSSKPTYPNNHNGTSQNVISRSESSGEENKGVVDDEDDDDGDGDGDEEEDDDDDDSSLNESSSKFQNTFPLTPDFSNFALNIGYDTPGSLGNTLVDQLSFSKIMNGSDTRSSFSFSATGLTPRNVNLTSMNGVGLSPMDDTTAIVGSSSINVGRSNVGYQQLSNHNQHSTVSSTSNGRRALTNVNTTDSSGSGNTSVSGSTPYSMNTNHLLDIHQPITTKEIGLFQSPISIVDPVSLNGMVEDEGFVNSFVGLVSDSTSSNFNAAVNGNVILNPSGNVISNTSSTSNNGSGTGNGNGGNGNSNGNGNGNGPNIVGVNNVMGNGFWYNFSDTLY